MLHQTFSALGDPVRFAIVEHLLNNNEMSAGELQIGQTISAPAISRHLRVLRTAGVIVQRVDRQRRLYSINPSSVRAIHKWTLDHRSFWEASLARLELALDKESSQI